jgi:hypothetical protein
MHILNITIIIKNKLKEKEKKRYIITIKKIRKKMKKRTK